MGDVLDEMAIFQDDTILPTQLLVDRERSPEEELWACVLQSALKLALLGRGSKGYSHSSRPAVAEAKAWFANEATQVASFLWVCDMLGVEASYIRRCVARLPADHRTPIHLHSTRPWSGNLTGPTGHNVGSRFRRLSSERRRKRASVG